MQIDNLIRARLRSSIDVHQKLFDDPSFLKALAAAADHMVKCLQAGGTIFFFGNGGSAADAQHLAAEFTGRYLMDRRPLPAIALSVNTSALTSIGNDYGFEVIFSRQLQALGKKGDLAVGITTSGNSPNVARALEFAKSQSMFTLALTGSSGGLVGDMADCVIRIPSDETPRIQECQIFAGHIICEIVEQQLFGQLENNGLSPELSQAPGVKGVR